MKHQHLPHIDLPHHYQFVTFRTKDSTDDFLLKLYGENKPNPEKQLAVDQYLDSSNQGSYLYDEALLQLRHFLCQKDGDVYALVCFAIMPNHVHMLFNPLQNFATVMQVIKGGSARLLNEALNRKGSFWAKDYYDKLIRDEKHFQTVYDYIKQNPMRLSGATKVAPPSGGEALASPNAQGYRATKVIPLSESEGSASQNERFYSVYE